MYRINARKQKRILQTQKHCTNILSAFSHTTVSSSGRKRIQKTCGLFSARRLYGTHSREEAKDVVVERREKEENTSTSSHISTLPAGGKSQSALEG